jgi:hypothetical protein
MTSLEIKGDLHSYLQGARESSVWNLDRLGEYDIRRPLTPTGTNLLGLVKHSAGTQPLGRPPQRSRQRSLRRPGLVGRLPRPGRSSGPSRQRQLTAGVYVRSAAALRCCSRKRRSVGLAVRAMARS